MKQTYQISPSILSADFARLGEDVTAVIKAGADRIHFDVMDNHFVPNLTFGSMVCQALRDYGVSVPIDVHLMVKPVDELITSFAKAGASCIVFHPEASTDIDSSIALIKSFDCEAGLVLNPETNTDCLKNRLALLDRVLIMSVNPGFAGQKFMPAVLTKATKIRQMIDELAKPIRLEIDGGINQHNIKSAADAGIDTFVAGSAVFAQPDYKAAINSLRATL